MAFPTRLVCPLFVVTGLVACGGSSDAPADVDPTDVKFGDTALVVVVNPAINEQNRDTVAMPGQARSGVVLRSDDGLADTTGADGIAVLAPLTAGTRTIEVSGGGIEATFTVTIAAGELREVALATEASRADVMVDIDYKTDRMFEVTPDMTVAQLNDALKVSDRVVFVRGGTYTGDLDFSGSRVTLFGEGVLGGAVTLTGNVTISGSDSRIRGAHITGDLTVPASGTGLSFSQVDGNASVVGSDATVLANALCGGGTISGSGSVVLGNAGIAPTTTCP